MAETNAIAAPVKSAGTKEWVACAIAPVRIGANAPPRKPPKFWTAPSEAIRLGGAAAVASAQEQALAALARNTTTEMQASAITLLDTNAAGTVKSAMPTMAATTGILRLRMGDALRCVSKSENQPATRHPKKPQKKGIAEAKPVPNVLMCRSISRYPGSQVRKTQFR